MHDYRTGDVLKFWHDSGCRGAELAFALVLKVGAKKIQVRDENGTIGWRYPHFFCGRVSATALAEMRKEGSLTL